MLNRRENMLLNYEESVPRLYLTGEVVYDEFTHQKASMNLVTESGRPGPREWFLKLVFEQKSNFKDHLYILSSCVSTSSAV